MAKHPALDKKKSRRWILGCGCLTAFAALWAKLLHVVRRPPPHDLTYPGRTMSSLELHSPRQISNNSSRAKSFITETSVTVGRREKQPDVSRPGSRPGITWTSPPSFTDVPGGIIKQEEPSSGLERKSTVPNVPMLSVSQPSSPSSDFSQQERGFASAPHRSKSKGVTQTRGSVQQLVRSKTIVIKPPYPAVAAIKDDEPVPPITDTLATGIEETSSSQTPVENSQNEAEVEYFEMNEDGGEGSRPVAVYDARLLGSAPSHLRDFPCTLPGSLLDLSSQRHATSCQVVCDEPSAVAAATTTTITTTTTTPPPLSDKEGGSELCGVKLCTQFVECHAVVLQNSTSPTTPNAPSLQSSRNGKDEKKKGGGTVAVLKTDSRRSRDDSLARLQRSKWWGTPQLSTNPKPRLYVVCSYGGSGSKMLSGFLDRLPKQHRAHVWHLHDRFPPTQLRRVSGANGKVISAVKALQALEAKPDLAAEQEMRKKKAHPPRHRRAPPGGFKPKEWVPKPPKDFRKIAFEGDARWRNDTELIRNPWRIGDYRVVFIYKDPSEALVSRYSFEHCLHIQGDCNVTVDPARFPGGPKPRNDGTTSMWDVEGFPDLAQYASRGVDFMRLKDHFNAYLHPPSPSSSSSSAPPQSGGGGGGAGGGEGGGGGALEATTRNYPVVALNYHKLWDNLPAMFAALGLPQELEASFPERKETVRTGGGDRFGGGGKEAASEATRKRLRDMYSDLVDEIARNPAVLVV